MRPRVLLAAAGVAAVISVAVVVVLIVVLAGDDKRGDLSAEEEQQLITLGDAAEAAGRARPVFLTRLPYGLQHVPIVGDDPTGRFLVQYFNDADAVLDVDYIALFLNIHQTDYDSSEHPEVGAPCEESEIVHCILVNDTTVSVERVASGERPSYEATIVVGDQLLETGIDWQVLAEATPDLEDELISEYRRALESTKDSP